MTHLTVKEAADVKDVTPSCVRQWIDKGWLPARFVGVWLIKPSDLTKMKKPTRGRPRKLKIKTNGGK